MNSYTDDFSILDFQRDLVDWYKMNQRDLPWRADQDPYKVWVSEIMLQQTRVDTVIPYFNRFLGLFPTLEALAEADEEKVLKAWEGLGYYSRVRNLQTAVKAVAEQYGGRVPDTPDEISKLKGVGPYTAGAILSIAYGVPEPAVDGNVMRVLSRILLIEEDIGKPKTRTLFEKAVRELISKEDPSSFNQALMELGALICTPKSPACLICPVHDHCRAFEQGRQRELPVKEKKTKARQVDMAALILRRQDGRYLIHKRPKDGLLANLWEFPNVPVKKRGQSETEDITVFLEAEWGITAEIGDHISNLEHIFSHLKWDIQIFEGRCINENGEKDNLKWVTFKEMETYPFPVSHQKIIKLAKEVAVL
ncbi:A/G-specific DNA-adenine glycosylase [Fictibacillus solisalsi]|uniref:Adenine DNA glycosylase n=1 Tax=Fictibacillus solisalsi TaxID=459525 RepID=A0A1H0AFR3_9BACL|nr:A/G-specific adenine glycosylase [Fictibacillus solisalsi]SDN32141.1 A/G-specific DNA-adenine glycosylase [Fictibacillus solisalsi]